MGAIIVLVCLLVSVWGKPQDKINIGVYLTGPSSQIDIPLNDVIYKNMYERRTTLFSLSRETLPEGDAFRSAKLFCNSLEKVQRLAAVLVSESPTASPVVQKITSRLDLPHVQTNWRESNTYLGSATTLNFHPEYTLISQGLASIVKSLQWKSFTILYETNEGLSRLQEVLQLQTYDPENHKTMVKLQKIQIGNSLASTLKAVKQTGETRIVLECEIDNIMEVLEQAKEVGLLTFVNSFFITSLDAHTLDLESLDTEANITTVRIVNPENENFNSVVKSWEFNELQNNRLSELKPYDIKTETVLVYESISLLFEAINDVSHDEVLEFADLSCEIKEKFQFGHKIISYMKSVAHRPSLSGNLQFDEFGRRTNFTLYIVEGNRGNIIATWESMNPNIINQIRTEEERTKEVIQSLQKGVKIISSRLEVPYLMLKTPEDGEVLTGNDRYEGYAIDLMHELAAILQMNFEISICKENRNGYFDEGSGTWKGIIGDIIDHKALFGIGDITITPLRESVVDFTMPFMRLGIDVLLKKSEDQVSMFAFLNPLSMEVWMYTATLFLTVSIVLYFVARMAPGDWENPHPCNLTPSELENIWDIKNCLWLPLGSITNQGSDILPKGISSRLVASMWWFFALIITNSYIANLAAFLTNDKGGKINDIETLATQNRIKYGILQGGSTEDFFKKSNYSTYRRMYANMLLSLPSVFVSNNEEGIKRVQSTRGGTYAFLMESTQIDYLVVRHCDLTNIGKPFIHKEYGIAMQLESPYRTAVNDAILQLQEHGKLSELKNRWWREKNTEPPCITPPSGSELRFENVGGIFWVLGVGLVIALLLGIMEFLWTVRETCVEEHVSYWEAFKTELLFALKVWVSKKRCKQVRSESRSSSANNSVKGSLFNLNVLSKVKNHFSRNNLNVIVDQ